MDYKIVFFDVDGTITSELDGTIPNSTKKAIKALLNNGIKVVAATGRPLSMCNELIALGIETFITANGGYAKHKDQVIHKIPLDINVIKEVVEFASKENHALSYYTEEFSMNGVRDLTIMNTLKETLFLTEYPTINSTILGEEVYLMCLFANDTDVQKYKNQFPQLTFKRWHPYIVNVLQQDLSKSIAILKVLEYFGFHQSEAVAFGDGENDIDMLEFVGLGIAMGNASERVKSFANDVTKKSSENGIEYALQKYGLISEDGE